MLKGVRGAIQADENSRPGILDATEQLMRALIETNRILPEFVSAVFMTVTPGLNAAFPAEVRKRIGWDLVPFLCGQEIPVVDAMERVIRVLILFETDLTMKEIRHQYLGAAAALRPDLKK
jgi:chorismate mutase